jgi:hypothetical protein
VQFRLAALVLDGIGRLACFRLVELDEVGDAVER